MTKSLPDLFFLPLFSKILPYEPLFYLKAVVGVVIGFLIDTSNGMMIHWDKYKEAATELMLNLLPGDKRYSGYLIS